MNQARTRADVRLMTPLGRRGCVPGSESSTQLGARRSAPRHLTSLPAQAEKNRDVQNRHHGSPHLAEILLARARPEPRVILRPGVAPACDGGGDCALLGAAGDLHLRHHDDVGVGRNRLRPHQDRRRVFARSFDRSRIIAKTFEDGSSHLRGRPQPSAILQNGERIWINRRLRHRFDRRVHLLRRSPSRKGGRSGSIASRGRRIAAGQSYHHHFEPNQKKSPPCSGHVASVVRLSKHPDVQQRLPQNRGGIARSDSASASDCPSDFHFGRIKRTPGSATVRGTQISPRAVERRRPFAWSVFHRVLSVR
jgi:hypothetical protein